MTEASKHAPTPESMDRTARTFPTVVVLGSHRSGTSMVAGILHALGIHMGTGCSNGQLIYRGWSNPNGIYEDTSFLALNRRILSASRGEGRTGSPQLETEIMKRLQFAELQILAANRRYNGWGWKDPQTLLTIEYFLPHLSNPFFIVCRRDPADALRSLIRCGWYSDSTAAAIIHEEEVRLPIVMSLINRYPVLIIAYEDSIGNPATMVSAIVDFLGLPVSEQQRRLAEGVILDRVKVVRLGKRVSVVALLRYPKRILLESGKYARVGPRGPFLNLVTVTAREAFALSRNLVRPAEAHENNPNHP
jgi:hypothetical protein